MNGARFRNRRSLVILGGWLAGVATILYFAPPVFEGLPHQWGDWVLGFQPGSHEVVILSGAVETVNKISFERDLNYRGPIVLWNVKTGERRSLPLPANSAICRAKLAGPGNLFCQEEKRLLFIDLDSGRKRDLVDLSGGNILPQEIAWQVSDDGKILAYFKGLVSYPSPSGAPGVRVASTGQVVCYDLESGRRLGEYPSSEWLRSPSGLLSPGGNLVAVSQAGKARILSPTTGKTILRLRNDAWPSRFSPDGSLLLDHEGEIWDLATGKVRLRGRPPPQAAFADGGRLLVEAGIEGDNALLTCRDVQTGALRLRLPLPEAWHFRVGPCGTNDRLVAVNLESHPGRVVQTYWFEKLLTRLSRLPKQSIVRSQQIVFDEDYSLARVSAFALSGYQSRIGLNHCMLVDTANGRSMLETAGYLRAVSDDCRYAVTEDNDQLAWKLWELPPRKPAGTMLLAALAWSLAVIGLVAMFARRRRHALRRQIVGPK
jgi:hypothetical protein